MVTPLLGGRDDPAELALQPVDGGTETAGIDEIVVGFAIKFSDRRLEVFELNRHAQIIRILVRLVHSFSVNLYSLPHRPRPPDLPIHRLIVRPTTPPLQPHPRVARPHST